ncbi:MAG: GNAT family protein [Caldilineaceae bacterium]
MNAYEMDPTEAENEPDLDAVFGAFPQLETPNLHLRELTEDDAADLLAVFADEEVTRFYDLYAYESEGEALELIDFFTESFEVERSIRWGIARKTDNRLVGTCGYVSLRRFRGEIGYELNRAFWRQGIMKEALAAIIQFGFEQLKLNRIEALVMVENAASAGLLRSLGFHEEGILREHDYFKGQFHDMRCFALLRREWKPRVSQT